jgi:hypothetical protein
MPHQNADAVAKLFGDFDTTDMPHIMGTRRRQLFYYRGLYFHLQDFEGEHGGEAIEEHRKHPLFVGHIHSDNGPSMTSKGVAQLLVDLGVTRSLSRPHVSNDNPYVRHEVA